MIRSSTQKALAARHGKPLVAAEQLLLNSYF